MLKCLIFVIDYTRKKRKRRRRIRKNSDSSDDNSKKKSGRKNIRKVIRTADLEDETKEAAKREQERKKRIEERQKLVRIHFRRIFHPLACKKTDHFLFSFASMILVHEHSIMKCTTTN